MNQAVTQVWWVARKMEFPHSLKSLLPNQTLVLKYYNQCLIYSFCIILNTQCYNFFHDVLFFVSFRSLRYIGTYLEIINVMPRCCMDLYQSFLCEPELRIGVYKWQTSPQAECPWATCHFFLECGNKILSILESFLNDLNGQ